MNALLALLLAAANAFQPARIRQRNGGALRAEMLDHSTLSALEHVATTAAHLSSAPSQLAAPAVTTLQLAEFQDFRDAVSSVVRPFAFLLALPAFGLALIPLTLAVAVARAAAAPAKSVADTLASVPTDAWIKLLFCIAVDAAGDLSEALPGATHGVAEAILGPLDFYLLRLLFEDSSLVLPAVGLLEEWLPFPEALPVATVAWALETLASDSKLAKALNLG
eukprot:CAMPEP_0119266996 /NCGR_PEP_ID=MMETSP1329-20130426/5295_1 /TAXON_ID=114041 /ORGANISM="Genus nov. species nov., Strain RCC1024" /LENGTH=221 /DNA_ID=CAMNT_0007266901 /DNA_START=115 /DNA_END=777 /DNA_ORIENTATION=+